jgi:AAA15 family ATPase/GTPase
MITEILIKNFKTIQALDLKLGRFNLFIGENGCGKTNILEAIALGTAASEYKLDNEYLNSKGIRITEPNSLRSGFTNDNLINSIDISFIPNDNDSESIHYFLQNDNKPYSKWENLYEKQIKKHFKENFKKSDAKEIVDKILNNGKIKSYEIYDEKSKKNRKIIEIEEIKKIIEETITKENLLNSLDDIYKENERKINKDNYLSDFKIFAPENNFLRVFEDTDSKTLGYRGEGLFKLISIISKEKPEHLLEIKKNLNLIGWFDDFEIPQDISINQKVISISDKYIKDGLIKIDQRSSNEGFLYLLFYFTLFVSNYTPNFFAIDNIDIALNPKLCNELIKVLVKLSNLYNKQVILTTHNPAVLDGLDLKDVNQRLFVVSRNKMGYTRVNRIEKKELIEGKTLKLSEQFLRGYLGGLPKNF